MMRLDFEQIFLRSEIVGRFLRHTDAVRFQQNQAFLLQVLILLLLE